MPDFELIKDKSQLDGTCYIELSLGKYQGRHWEDTSIFLNEETFGLFEAVFRKNVPEYDHYSMNDADSQTWIKVIAELTDLKKQICNAENFEETEEYVNFLYDCTYNDFKNDFSNSKSQLLTVLSELIEWAESSISMHDHIAILGI